MVNNFTNLFICAVLVESIAEIIIEVSGGNKYITKLMPIFIGILMSFSTSTGFFSAVGLNSNNIFDYILTGIILSRGSNFIHNIFKVVESRKNNQLVALRSKKTIKEMIKTNQTMESKNEKNILKPEKIEEDKIEKDKIEKDKKEEKVNIKKDPEIEDKVEKKQPLNIEKTAELKNVKPKAYVKDRVGINKAEQRKIQLEQSKNKYKNKKSLEKIIETMEMTAINESQFEASEDKNKEKIISEENKEKIISEENKEKLIDDIDVNDMNKINKEQVVFNENWN